MGSRFARFEKLIAIGALLSACAAPTRHSIVPAAPTTGSPIAHERFSKAQQSFQHDGDDNGEFHAIAAQFPSDPVAPFARLYDGMAAFKAGRYVDADAALALVIDPPPGTPPEDAALMRRARLLRGLSLNYLGKADAARPLLDNGESAAENEGERIEWVAAMASVASVGQAPLSSLPYFDRWWPHATPAERGYILARVTELATAANAGHAKAAWDELASQSGVAAAILGARVANDRQAAGDSSGAEKIRKSIASARQSIGLLPLASAVATPATVPVAVVAPTGRVVVGACVPQTGKRSRVGEKALRGLSIAVGALGTAQTGDAAAAERLVVEVQSVQGPQDVAAAVDALASQGAAAIIGPIDGPEIDAVGERAEKLPMTVLSLAARPEERASHAHTYHMMHSAESRARVLARRSLAAGVKLYAILGPDNGYGRAVSAAFADEVTRGGGSVVAKPTYPADSKSFATVVKKLDGGWDALFIPDQADKLELIAPALAAAGLVPKPLATKKVPRGRPVLLLSTAEGVDAAFVAAAGRHSEGAWFAPGFYADASDTIAGDFVRRFVAAYGKEPGAIEAYAYDAATLVALLAGGDADWSAKLRAGASVGVTGPLRFSVDHRRSDDGVVFEVVTDASADGGFAIRARR